MENNSIETDICIIGGGVTGASIAASLGNTGKRITIIERNWEETDRIVGELLQPAGVHMLDKLGLSQALDNIDAQVVTGYSVYNQNKAIHIDYPLTKEMKPGLGFRNGKFVQNLRACLKAYPNIQCIEGNVTALHYSSANRIDGAVFLNSNGISVQVHAPLTIVCDGIFSKLRSELTTIPHKVTGFFAGLILDNCRLPHPDHGHVFITDTSPFVVYPVASGKLRMLIDMPGEVPPKMQDGLIEILKQRVWPFLPDSMKQSFDSALQNEKIKMMPNHKLHPAPAKIGGVVIIGDAFNMRHPLTGGGMTVAFTDVYRLSQYIKKHLLEGRLLSEEKYINDFYSDKSDETGVINILADALYNVLRQPVLSHACFSYLQQGGDCATGPISLLSGIERNKGVLMKHFSAVAKHACTKHNQAMNRTDIVKEAVRIIRPLYLHENPVWHHKLLLQLSLPFISQHK